MRLGVCLLSPGGLIGYNKVVRVRGPVDRIHCGFCSISTVVVLRGVLCDLTVRGTVSVEEGSSLFRPSGQ